MVFLEIVVQVVFPELGEQCLGQIRELIVVELVRI